MLSRAILNGNIIGTGMCAQLNFELFTGKSKKKSLTVKNVKIWFFKDVNHR
jgi:hypothetical protein